MRRLVCESYPADKLPRDLHPGLPSGRRVRVVIEDEVTDQELREELDRKIQEGLEDLAAGRAYTLEEVEAALRAGFERRVDAAE